ncbi:hypothetical protein P389DRAFT_165638 [Cystobasidium minutum MCA 4210]|uniref:uncharacterized protein n=1 Tax=Cystobasidium minutum MCA 4210 TaxID=1397322 RepID=UPI0034CE908F|eukprot:jgi/Rhomi1/165638/fgenesh1_kg.1_\
MSLPRIAAQIVLVGGQIVGRAFVEAWKQAGRNMRAGESAIGGGSSSVGVGATDSVSRTYKMTFDEACNILNVKKDLLAKPQADESALQELLKNYEKMMKMNEKTSHYLQSKIVRARERIEAELPGMSKTGQAAAKEGGEASATSASTQTPPS